MQWRYLAAPANRPPRKTDHAGKAELPHRPKVQAGGKAPALLRSLAGDEP